MSRIKLPNFDTKRELYEYLVANKSELIGLKKSAIKLADSVTFDMSIEEGVNKAAIGKADSSKDTDTVIHRSIIGNTYNWLDSHEDVHVKNCFKDSIKQKSTSQIFHLHDHLFQIAAKVGKFDNIYEDEISWKDLGIDKEGNTEALMADSAIRASLNSQIFDDYKSGDITQHSVGMQYVKISFAINDPDFEQEYKEWQAVFPLLGNPDKAEKLGYFYVVKEAKLIEISCVLAGSNELTPTLEPLKLDPSKDSLEDIKTDPSKETVKKTTFNYYNYL